LRNVSGFADLLQKSAGSQLDAQAQRYLSIITDETKRMGILIDELLAFSRLGRAEPRKTPVDLNQLIQEVRDNLQLETQGREIRWRVGVLPQVCADRALLRQVIVNLIANAIKFTRTRPVAEIEVGALSLTTNDTEDVFFIRDNGVGFNMQYKGKLFGVFQRLHGTSEFEGTGIGLASVQRIVNRHGGRVWAEAAVDQGATFFVSLPKETAKETARMEIWI
jgi:light-regulated signal transduction histidine kinase (bacteriophytochrome)